MHFTIQFPFANCGSCLCLNRSGDTDCERLQLGLEEINRVHQPRRDAFIHQLQEWHPDFAGKNNCNSLVAWATESGLDADRRCFVNGEPILLVLHQSEVICCCGGCGTSMQGWPVRRRGSIPSQVRMGGTPTRGGAGKTLVWDGEHF